jgi:hypothetical protein
MIPFPHLLKETTMPYKTIVLELLKQRPTLFDRLLGSRTLDQSLEHYASELQTSHEVWEDRLSQTRPGSDESQIASEALEVALIDLEDCLDSMSEAPSTEGVLPSVRRRTPPD